MKNNRYWEKRLDEVAQRRYELQYGLMEKELKKLYESMQEVIKAETEELYLKLLEEELKRSEVWTYKRYKDLIKTINREAVKLGMGEIDILNHNLEYALKDVYNGSELPKAIQFNLIDDATVKQLIATPWSEKHFSQTVWDNKKKLVNTLKKGITESIVLGKSKDKLVEAIMQKLNQGFNASDNVVRTELMATINNAQLQKYKDNGYAEGKILIAKDDRTCDHCKEYWNNGEPKELKSIILPVHPRCRCTAVPITGLEEKVKETILNNSNSDIIQLEDIVIPKSLGAAAFRDRIKLPDSTYGLITQGTKITKVVVFAGKGTNKPIKMASYLAKQYNVPEAEWQKVRGDGYVDVNGVSKHAELHWFESQQTGRIKMKVKRWF